MNNGDLLCKIEEIEAEEILNVKKSLQEIYSIWLEFGLSFDRKANRARVVFNHVQKLLKDIYDEEFTLLEEYRERVKDFDAKVKELYKELQMTPSETEGSLIQKEEMLRQELDNLTNVKHRRRKAYQELKVEEKKLCRILNLQEHQLPPNVGVPSEKDISEIEQHVKMLKGEKERRQKKFSLARRELSTILEVTELTPESSLEKDLLSGRDTLSLTNETFKAVEEVISKAQKKKAELEAKRRNLIDKLTVLYKRLEVEESERVEFLAKHDDCKISTIRSIEQELQRCEAIKLANLGSFISNLRAELVQLWDKCYVSQHERDLFHYFSQEDLSDEALEAHEAEVEKWKKYYATVEHIIQKIEERKKLWDLMIVFENKANDPNRFKNRKGNLLKEERDRKKLQKDLPALENNIFEDIAGLGELKFQYHGEDFQTYVTNQWSERMNQKEQEKLERQNRNLLQVGRDATMGTPLKRTLMHSPKSAPSKLFKSSLSTFRTPAATRSRAINQGTNRLTPSSVSKVSVTGRLFQSAQKPPKPGQNILKESNKQTATKCPRNKQPPAGKSSENKPSTSTKSSALDRTTYTAFSSELDKTERYNFRSSALASKKRGGSRISQTELNRSKRKSEAKSLRKSLKNASSNLTPARGKLGLPFLI